MRTVPRVFAYLPPAILLMMVVFPAVTKFIMLTSSRRQAGDDLFEAAVAAERLPEGMQTQVSVT